MDRMGLGRLFKPTDWRILWFSGLLSSLISSFFHQSGTSLPTVTDHVIFIIYSYVEPLKPTFVDNDMAVGLVHLEQQTAPPLTSHESIAPMISILLLRIRTRSAALQCTASQQLVSFSLQQSNSGFCGWWNRDCTRVPGTRQRLGATKAAHRRSG